MRDNEIQAVTEQRQSHNLEDEYLKQFAIKYQMRARLTDDDRAILGFITKSVGIIEAARIIESYFRIEDKWFSDNAYSLPVLKKNLNKVIASMGNTRGAVSEGRGPKMTMLLSCDKCFGHYSWQGYSSELNKPRICEKCK